MRRHSTINGRLRHAGFLAGVAFAAGFFPPVVPAQEPAPAPPPEPLRGIYDRPFLAEGWRRAHIGGYTELEYHAFADRVLGIPEGFRMHRTNLFLFSELSDRLRFGSEIEFETGLEGGSPSREIEVAVEMAFLDWTLFEEFKLRAGAIVAPVGRVNVNHDGPARELTERPLVSTFVIPTTWTEVGAGAHGVFDLHDELQLGYEAYAVNGMNLLSSDGELAAEITEREQLLREGRRALGGDQNGRPAGTGRIGIEALSSIAAGFSWHLGTYDEEGDRVLGLVAGDLAVVREAFGAELGLEGEIALASFERDDLARSAGVPEELFGWYLQGSVSGLPDFLIQGAPFLFAGPGARLTLVFRWDRVDLDGDVGEALEPGLNFRPAADTALRFSWRFNQRRIGLRGVPGRPGGEDDGFVCSVTTYF